MAFQDCQYMAQMTKRIQVIRLRCFRYAVADRAGFRTIDTVGQLPFMFMSAEIAECSLLRCVIILYKFASYAYNQLLPQYDLRFQYVTMVIERFFFSPFL